LVLVQQKLAIESICITDVALPPVIDMKRSRFTESQISDILERFRSGQSVAELCDQYGISASTLYTWRSRRARLLPDKEDVVHRVQKENRRLRRIILGMIEETDKLKGMIRSSQNSARALSPRSGRSDLPNSEELAGS
jgi:putative transposase